MRKFSYSFISRLYYSLNYIYTLFLIPFECKKGTFTILVVEIVWILRVITKLDIPLPKKFYLSQFITKYGKYTIEPGLVNTKIISPVFERQDVDFLLSLIKKELSMGKKVLFLDIGACFGTYTIAVGNAFKDFSNITIYAFEPDYPGLWKDSFFYLKKNVKDNNINSVKLFHIGLGSKNSDKPNKMGIKTRRLDDVMSIKELKKYDSIFMKIDVEEYLKDVLLGSSKFIKYAPKFTLLAEDYFRDDMIAYLEKNFIFYNKRSPYNSFWIKI